jgi:hypothetical protein
MLSVMMFYSFIEDGSRARLCVKENASVRHLPAYPLVLAYGQKAESSLLAVWISDLTCVPS